MPLVNTRKGRPKKAGALSVTLHLFADIIHFHLVAETSPTKRPARNKRGGKIPLASPAQDENSIMPGVMMQNDEPNSMISVRYYFTRFYVLCYIS